MIGERRLAHVTFVIAVGAMTCASTPSFSDQTNTGSAISSYVGEVAASCVSADFDPSKVRMLLLELDFVEKQRPFQHQLEKFPPNATPLTQGIFVPWKRPCKPSVDARYVRASLASVADVLTSSGFTTSDGLFFEKNGKSIRLQSRGSALGGPAEINIQPF